MDWLRIPAPSWDVALAIGRRRQRLKERTTGSTTPLSDVETNAIGYIAERAFAKWYGLPATAFREDLTADPGFDFETPAGRIDVKGSKARPYFLPVRENAFAKRPGADLFVLLFTPVRQSWAFVVGFATREEVERYPVVANCFEPRGRRTGLVIPGRVIPVSALRAPAELTHQLDVRATA